MKNSAEADVKSFRAADLVVIPGAESELKGEALMASLLDQPVACAVRIGVLNVFNTIIR